jgi:hypothetical protein
MRSFPIEDEKTTFSDMRRTMDFQFVDGMTRRTIMYQEIQGWCTSSPNPHGWPTRMIHKYYFGFYATGEARTPEIIPVRWYFGFISHRCCVSQSNIQAHCENLLLGDVLNLRAAGEDVTADLIIIPRQ